MPRGNEAKSKVIDKIKQAFGADYVATVDGKVYVQARENGEMVQIALALTCPKNPVAAEGASSQPVVKMDFGGNGWDFDNMDNSTVQPPEKSSEISQQEIDDLETMMRNLGLI